jgi:hypothetical protein
LGQLFGVHASQPAIRTDLGAIFVSLELSRSSWLITSLSPGAGERVSKHSVAASDVGGLLARLSQLQQKAASRLDSAYPIIAIPRGRSRRVLDPSGSNERRGREPRRRRGVDPDLSTSAPGQDGSD